MLFTAIWSLVVRRSAYVYAMTWWFHVFQYARFPLSIVSGCLAGLYGTWIDGVMSGLVVAAIDGSIGWWMSATLLKPRLAPLPRAHFFSITLPLAIAVPLMAGPLLGGIGAVLTLLWKWLF